MEKINDIVMYHGVHYTFIKRNGRIALFGVGTKTSSTPRHWEVSIIYCRKDKYKGEREVLPNDSQFGRDRSRYFVDEKQALEYFDELAEKMYQWVPKIVSGVDENKEVTPEYHDEEILEPCCK